MPIFFGEVAPYCPISRDGPGGVGGGMPTRGIPTRTNIPRVHDLPSAIAGANILRSIINQIVRDRVINNVYTRPSAPPRKSPADRVIDMTRNDARWVEQKKQRIKKKYIYYGDETAPNAGSGSSSDSDPNAHKSYVITERIERMVWYDKAWKTYLTFTYGDKGEGEPYEEKQASGATSGQ